MPIEALSQDRLARLAGRYGLSLSADDLKAMERLCEGLKASYDRIDELAGKDVPEGSRRPAGRAPEAGANPFNAWAWISDIASEASGPLKGYRIGIKDNICVAGLPMRNGSRLFEGFVPRQDATVVSRILAAGGIIAGKTVCEDLCFSGGSHTSRPLPVLNPFDPKRSAGGSSSGNAVAIAAGDVAMCVGGDQGGSVRTPASWCGIVGLKPTYGLVPYTGAFPIEPTLDHLGPMGRTVENAARLLSVIAGSDELDPRQPSVQVQDYAGSLSEPVLGLKIGIVREGFGRPESLGAVDQCVRRAVARLATQGAETQEVSIPWHTDGYHLAAPFLIEGASEFLFESNATGFGLQGRHPSELGETWAKAWRERPDDLPDIAKWALLFNSHVRETCAGRYYGRARNLRYALRAAYDRALEAFDVLVMPTTPLTATELPGPNSGFEARVSAGLAMEGNTSPFDLSGHPAISVPCGLADGLPVGLMFIGRHFHERSVLRAAAGFERLGDWRAM